jgi:urea transport system permease protein
VEASVVTIFWSQLFTGISVGAVLLMIALGLTFTFGQMNVINMAHGEFIMAGAYTAYMLGGVMGATSALFVSLPVAFVVAGLMGVLLEVVLIRRLYGRPLDTLLVTWGVALMLQQLARDLFGAPNVQVVAPSWLGGGIDVLGTTFPSSRLFIIALVAVSLAGIWLFMSRLPAGRRMRAVMQNRQLAACSGIGTDRVDRSTFFLGSGLAGVAGVALTLLGSIGPTLGTNYIVDAFLVVVVGGLGQLRGAIIAAFALGILNAFVEYWTQASLAKVIVFVTIVLFLQLRPQGLVVMRSRSLA